MNIFVTDLDPRMSARNLDDKRVIKMCLESAQMLSTTMSVLGIKGPYLPTHVNHPCTVWVRQNRSNYIWLLSHFIALCTEYKERYRKTHKCEQYVPLFTSIVDALPEGPLTPFVNCTDNKHLEVIEAYWVHLRKKWNEDKRTPTWNKSSRD